MTSYEETTTRVVAGSPAAATAVAPVQAAVAKTTAHQSNTTSSNMYNDGDVSEHKDKAYSPNHDDESSLFVDEADDPSHNRTDQVVQRIPLPLQIFQTWQTQHSAAVLRTESPAQLAHQRRYLHAIFSCPRQAGIHMADYTTTLLLAVATNRTLLLEYNSLGLWLQQGQNAPAICQRILQRADWIPDYHEIAAKLVESHPYNTTTTTATIHWMEGTHYQTGKRQHPNNNNSNNQQHHYHTASRIQDIVDRVDQNLSVHDDISAHTIIHPFRLWGLGVGNTAAHYFAGRLDLRDVYAGTYFSQTFGLQSSSPAQLLLHRQKRIHDLYAEGMAFLYGMLWAESFRFTTQLLQSVESLLVPPPTSSKNNNPQDQEVHFSIALHSRHAETTDTGANVQPELQCVQQLLQKHNTQHRPCRLYLMSDRTATVQAMLSSSANATTGCTVVRVVTHDDALHNTTSTTRTNNNRLAEHGPFAGAGYFQDLAVVSQARSGFCAKRRSSSAVIYELMAYRGRMEHCKTLHSSNDHKYKNKYKPIPFGRIKRRVDDGHPKKLSNE